MQTNDYGSNYVLLWYFEHVNVSSFHLHFAVQFVFWLTDSIFVSKQQKKSFQKNNWTMWRYEKGAVNLHNNSNKKSLKKHVRKGVARRMHLFNPTPSPLINSSSNNHLIELIIFYTYTIYIPHIHKPKQIIHAPSTHDLSL